MKDHNRTHTIEKPYVCSMCNSSFPQSCNRRTHMRTRTAANPTYCFDFKCSQLDEEDNDEIDEMHIDAHREIPKSLIMRYFEKQMTLSIEINEIDLTGWNSWKRF
ncbi:zinc finger protein [Loa loa]|uniref:Zinc finger protein n=1 Tax=Loa loa TaxID=7209 RepID=A0A1S0TJV9_LOALO|nr:zinc finger protein [Loa loa]EFO15306.2 zinc finger protein [Loa loa]